MATRRTVIKSAAVMVGSVAAHSLTPARSEAQAAKPTAGDGQVKASVQTTSSTRPPERFAASGERHLCIQGHPAAASTAGAAVHGAGETRRDRCAEFTPRWVRRVRKPSTARPSASRGWKRRRSVHVRLTTAGLPRIACASTWTPTGAARRRPVLVWIHGGASSGSSNELRC